MTDAGAPRDPARFSVLVVCTANRFRSPAGEYLLRRAAEAAGLPWAVRSAGTHAVPGQPMDPRTAEVLAADPATLRAWRTSQLDRTGVAAADLILVAADEHRRYVVTLDPAALHRTFPLRQFARLADEARTAGGSLRDGAVLLDQARRARARVQPAPPGEDDLPDPVGKPLRALRSTVELVDEAVRRIVGAATS